MNARKNLGVTFSSRPHFGVLVIFATAEVLFFHSHNMLHLAYTTVVYAFLFVLLLTRPRAAVQYWLAFSLLSMGSWSHIAIADPLYSFWGLRISFVSFNVLFTFVLFVFTIARCGLKKREFKLDLTANILVLFVLYSFVIGTLALLLDRVYLDDYLTDLFIFAPLPIYVYLLTLVDKNDLHRLIRLGLILTVYSMALSYTTGILFRYGGDFRFVLMNNMAYIAIFVIPVSWSVFSRHTYVALNIVLFSLLASGSVFLGGKSILVPILVLLWLLAHATSRRRTILSGAVLVIALLAVFFLPNMARLDPNALLTYKVNQITNALFTIDPHEIAAVQNSLGNIIAEAVTLLQHAYMNIGIMFFGLGFGGGIPDLFGYLAPMARPGVGYSVDSISRNLFHRTHLPLFEFILKGGVFGLSCYIFSLFRSARIGHVWGLALLIVLATVFTNSKDMILLALVLSRAASPHTDDFDSENSPLR